MISIGQDALGSKFAHFGMSNGFYGSARGGADESWSLNVAVRGMNNTNAHKASLFDDVEF